MGLRIAAATYPGHFHAVSCLRAVPDARMGRGTSYAALNGTLMGFASPLSRRLSRKRTARSIPLAIERTAIALSLGLYSALLVYVIPRHEPWSDEAQAWELAKSLSLKDLFGTYIHYEASPGLWHSLLWLLARAHVSYNGMHWFTAAIVMAAMVLLTTKAPFPLVLRLLLPFTYFFAFQYPVVARSYALFPVLLFALAWNWPQRKQNPLLSVLLIGLLANVSVHGLLVAIGLVVILSIERYRSRKEEGVGGKSEIVCAVLLIVMLGFAAWSIAPARDAGWVKIANWHVAQNRVAAKIGSLNVEERATNTHSAVVQVELAGGILERATAALGSGLSDFHIGLIAWGLLIWGWVRGGTFRYGLPVLFLWAFCAAYTFQFYHAGLFWVLFLFLWWVTYPQNGGRESRGELSKLDWRQMALLGSVVLCVISQLIWAARAIRYDVSMPYSAHRDAANILKGYLARGMMADIAIPPDNKGSGAFSITGIEPYFESEPISNMPFRFWFWGEGFDGGMRSTFLEDSVNRRAVVIVIENGDVQSMEKRLESIGYRRAQVVCGQMFYPAYLPLPICYAFYEP